MYKLCKTEQSAARQRQFENGLLQLMSAKRYEDITVSDLCEHLQIPRKSFYRYFSSKDGALHALIDHTLLGYESFNPVSLNGESRSLERDLTQFFLFWVEHKPLLDALERSSMSGVLVERAMSHAVSEYGIPSRFVTDESLQVRKQLILFCISGLMSLILTWHHEGYPLSAEEMAAVAARLCSRPLFPNLDKLY